MNVRKWTEGVFKLNDHSMESLEVQLDLMDFALAIFSPDDKVRSRKKEQSAPRDNTVFELGLFAGKIGRERSFFVVPRESPSKFRLIWPELRQPDIWRSRGPGMM